MRRSVYLVVVILALVSMLVACAPPAPTVATTQPSAPAAAGAPPQSAPTTAPAASAVTAATPAPTVATAPSPAPAAKVKRGGTLIMSQGSGPSTLDPALTINSGPVVEIPIFETLLRWDLKDPKTGVSDLGAEMAASWQIVDPKTITLKLQSGIKFHDGSDWNAEVAKWNLDRIMTHPKSMGKALVASVDKVDIVDPMTIKLTLKAPSATALIGLTRASGGTGSSASEIVSKAAVEKMGDDAFGVKPVGSGPYQVQEWKRDDRLLMTKFPGYWKKGADGQPLPYLDAVTNRYVVDKAVTLMELKAGTIQVVATIDSKDIAGVKSNPDLVFVSEPWASSFYVYGVNPGKEPFKSNQKLRQAMQYALDRDSIAKTLGFGEGAAQYYPTWNSSYPGYDESLFKYEFNLDKAKSLMKEAGLEGGINFEFASANPPNEQRAIEVMQAMWEKANIRVKLSTAETVAFRNKMKSNEFDVGHWVMSPSPDPDMYTRWLLCERPSNWSGYCNKQVDTCMLDGGSKYDAKERADIYKKCIVMVNQDAYVGGTFMLAGNIVHRKEVKGVRVQGWAMDLMEAWVDK
jgi:peptide/nickel transport system substrate-binding protein